ncbi:hypothetical protein QFZ64_000848 [Streptomyces sp. B3I8]|nr:hypothetical protein [Streptomyces sp. B3I8]
MCRSPHEATSPSSARAARKPDDVRPAPACFAPVDEPAYDLVVGLRKKAPPTSGERSPQRVGFHHARVPARRHRPLVPHHRVHGAYPARRRAKPDRKAQTPPSSEPGMRGAYAGRTADLRTAR